MGLKSKSSVLIQLSYFVFTILLPISFGAQDNTIVPNEKGSDVVNAVLYKMTQTELFPNDKRFYIRVAYVESRFGDDPNTYREGYYGGIWQVEESDFNKTKNNSNLENNYTAIKDHFGIDWNADAFGWDQLLKPLYSGIAAALFISTFYEPIPELIDSQAQLWKTYYDTPSGNGTVQEFIDAVHELESNNSCRAKINLVAVLDGSGSIGPTDFNIAKTAVSELLSRFELNTTSIGLVVFDTVVTTIFPVQKFNSSEFIKDLTNGIIYPGGGTNTHLGIDLAGNMLLEYSNNTEESAVNIMIVFTDGHSNDRSKTIASANEVIAAGITNFAVGIGSGIDPVELQAIAGNESSRVFTVNEFDTLIELVYSLNQGACEVPVKPPLNSTVEDEVLPNEKRYFNYELNENMPGIRIHMEKLSGDTIGYYSYTFKTPSAALNDGTITEEYAYILAPPPGSGNTTTSAEVFIAVEGIGNSTSQFNIGAEEDNTLIAKGVGRNILDEVILKVEVSKIFSNDHRFLTRVAYVESKFGEDPNTYRDGYFGGIWQLDEAAFLQTKNTSFVPELLEKYVAIKESYGIDWNTVVWDDLLKPFYSGLAARLFVFSLPEAIPESMGSQAQYWKTYYNTPWGNGTVQQFIDAVNELENTTVTSKAPVVNVHNGALMGLGAANLFILSNLLFITWYIFFNG